MLERESSAVRREEILNRGTDSWSVMAAPPDGQEIERKDTIRLVAAAIAGFLGIEVSALESLS